MKKSVIVFLVLAGLSSAAQAGLPYECSRYVNGEYKGFIKVIADNKQEAERKPRGRRMRSTKMNCA